MQLGSGNDLAITFADESTLNVDLGDAETLGDVLDALNAATPTKLSAAIAADGNRIELTDLTTGAAAFAVANVGTGTAASDLGLTSTADDDTITGRRLVSGLRDTLVSSLQGRPGARHARRNRYHQSQQCVVDRRSRRRRDARRDHRRDQRRRRSASRRPSTRRRNGIVLTDTTGATASNLIVADGDANESATALGIVADVAATSVNSGALDRQTVSAATLLLVAQRRKRRIGDRH